VGFSERRVYKMNLYQKQLSEKLDKFTEYIKTIPEIIGIYYAGSTATASWDNYSDLDICIVSKDKDYDKIVKMIPKLLSWWGEVKFYNKYETWDQMYAFIGKEHFKVEIEPVRISYFKKPHFDSVNIKIVYDTTGNVSHGKKLSQKLKKNHLDGKYFRWNLLDIRSNLIYVANHYARGQKIEALGTLDLIGNELFKLLAKTKNLEDWELRRVAEKKMTKKEKELWFGSRAKGVDKKEVFSSIKSAWSFMRYIEKEYEKASKKKLNLRTNDEEILNRILEVSK
jgi:hypothetical protein